QFNAYQIIRRKQYLRLLLHGFLHANWTHLLVNMLVFYSFGRSLEVFFQHLFGQLAPLYFAALYILAIIISPIYSLIKHRNNYHYNAVGASGAVSAVVFASIFFAPWEKIYFFGLVPIPGIIFAFLYLIYCWQMSKKDGDNIAHDAHFFGAVFGLLFPIILNPKLLSYFIEQLLGGL
ncbi:MAG: rhomboid family intramembrane serine protease, partial [Bacteroidetes bacterium]|nr:rhomboid family intramembrane serine protease [Bacteroidota bacterium]